MFVTIQCFGVNMMMMFRNFKKIFEIKFKSQNRPWWRFWAWYYETAGRTLDEDNNREQWWMN